MRMDFAAIIYTRVTYLITIVPQLKSVSLNFEYSSPAQILNFLNYGSGFLRNKQTDESKLDFNAIPSASSVCHEFLKNTHTLEIGFGTWRSSREFTACASLKCTLTTLACFQK